MGKPLMIIAEDVDGEEEELSTSAISCVMAAWRALLYSCVKSLIISPHALVALSIAIIRAACSLVEVSSNALKI